MKGPFPRLDPRITRELARQKRTIIMGLVCVALTSLLTTMMVPLTSAAITTLAQATPHAEDPAAAQPSGLLQIFQELRARTATPVDRSTLSPETIARQDRALQSLGNICLLVVALFVLKYWLTRGQIYYLSKAANRVSSDLRKRLFDKLMRLPVGYFNQSRTGELQSIVTNDVNVFQTAVGVIRDSIDGPIKATVALIFVFLFGWQLGLVALLFVPLVALVVTVQGRKIKTAQSKIQEDLAQLTGLAQEAFAGTRVIKAFSAEDRLSELHGQAVEQQFNSQITGARRIAALRPSVELIGAVAIAAIFFICGLLAREGLLVLAQIIGIVYALDMVNQGFKQISNVTATYNQVQASTDRLYDLVFDQPDETQDSPQATTIPEPRGRIEFQNVSFAYPDGTKALQNVSFTLQPGQSLALVGPSGAGKSTIADLILRFYDPTEGQIFFDGVDYKQLKISWLRRQFAVVPQQTFLFAGSIADNLRLGKPDATPDQLQKALEQANVKAVVDQIPERLETKLGERGVRLSGGELQRLAIARALVTDPTVLVLDEATSNLDAHSEKIVTQALEEVMSSRTTLFIAHRLTTAARADRILVLRKGEVLEQGSHADLLAQNSAYAGMYRAFTSGLIDDAAL